MNNKSRKKSDIYSENSSLMSDLDNVLKSEIENKTTNMTLKTIEARKVLILRNQRELSLTHKDIDDEGELLSKDNPTKLKEYESLLSLAQSIKQNGILNPISVYISDVNYILKAGQRRLLASLIAGKVSIIARIWDKDPGEYELEVEQWVENFHREDLSTKDSINAVKNITLIWERKNKKKIKVIELAKELYCSNGQATKYLSISNAPDDVQKAINTGQLTNLKKAYELSKIKDFDKRAGLLKLIISGELTQDEMTKIVLQEKNKPISINKTKSQQKISLGKTMSVDVVKEIVDLVVGSDKFLNLKKEFEGLEINDYKSATKMFKKLLSKMETVLSE